MQIHTLDKAGLINELQVGNSITHAVQEGRRADFSLLLSFFSNDVHDFTPVEKLAEQDTTESALRRQLGVSEPQALRSNSDSYSLSAEQAKQFHHCGLSGAKLAHYLTPEPLAYLPEDTCDLPEEVYQNLSGHERSALSRVEKAALPDLALYNQLSTAHRLDQIAAQA